MHYLDVHTHLTHEKFSHDYQDVIARAEKAGLSSIIVNGMDPQSNRFTLKMAQDFTIVKAALGIYPIHAVNGLLPNDFPLAIPRFDVDHEIEFIDKQAQQGNVFAIGECGLDAYWIDQNTFAEQERVFETLIDLAQRHHLALIIHTRKLEKRAGEILEHFKIERVNFHCFGGKTKLAQRYAEDHGWWFSIPANAANNEAFAKMLRSLPKEKILTETDAPYLAPVRGERNEPANVVGTVSLLARLRGWSVEEAREQIWENYLDLFQPHSES